jgi:hypothetical protein
MVLKDLQQKTGAEYGSLRLVRILPRGLLPGAMALSRLSAQHVKSVEVEVDFHSDFDCDATAVFLAGLESPVLD